jgi:1-acyl-sn-glycerol-3-phosphate acyltransferase
MHVLTSVVGYLLGSLLLIALTILATIQSIIGNQRLFDTQTKFICRWIPGVFGIRVITMGAENIDKAATQIFMANHVNIFDGFILYGHIPNFFRGIELEDHFSWPIWGFITKRLGNIPISHTNIESAVESLNRAREALSNGTSIGILPEGHRTRDGETSALQAGCLQARQERGCRGDAGGNSKSLGKENGPFTAGPSRNCLSGLRRDDRGGNGPRGSRNGN